MRSFNNDLQYLADKFLVDGLIGKMPLLRPTIQNYKKHIRVYRAREGVSFVTPSHESPTHQVGDSA
jgi:hypothetical protein